MRHSTWTMLNRSPLWRHIYGNYRMLPDGVRAPVRWIAAPHWQIATALIRLMAGGRVVSGPFKGMTLTLSPLSGRHLLGYILGTQELELREVIERIIARGYGTIVNVGAADGYYAVGLARRLPGARIFAFEALEEMRPVIKDAACANHVDDRVLLRGRCEPDDLRSTIEICDGQTLIFMDIEGGELLLLDPATTPKLGSVDIFLETHDCFVPDCTRQIMERFAATHDIEQYVARPRHLKDFPQEFMPVLPRLFPRLAVDLMDERRMGVQKWLFLKSKSSSIKLA